MHETIDPDGIGADMIEAAKWYRQAAVQGLPAAQFRLGLVYDRGAGGITDHAEAASWYRRSAEQGHPRAQFALGVLHENGRGVPCDHTAAACWYRRSAEQGFAPAQYNLGLLYGLGNGVPRDFVEAYAWLTLAISDELPEAAKARADLSAHLTPEALHEGERRALILRAQIVSKR